jgi:hypothetical protein
MIVNIHQGDDIRYGVVLEGHAVVKLMKMHDFVPGDCVTVERAGFDPVVYTLVKR